MARDVPAPPSARGIQTQSLDLFGILWHNSKRMCDFTSEHSLDFTSERKMAGRRAKYPRRPRRVASECSRLIYSERFRNKSNRYTIQNNVRFHYGALPGFHFGTRGGGTAREVPAPPSARGVQTQSLDLFGTLSAQIKGRGKGEETVNHVKSVNYAKIFCNRPVALPRDRTTRRWGPSRFRHASTPRAEGGAGTSRADALPCV